MAVYVIDNRPAPIEFEDGDAAEQTIRNCKNLLMCKMGEIPFDRLRGFDPALMDLPMEQFRAELLPEIDRVITWECDAEVIDATCGFDAKGELIISVTIEVADD